MAREELFTKEIIELSLPPGIGSVLPQDTEVEMGYTCLIDEESPYWKDYG